MYRNRKRNRNEDTDFRNDYGNQGSWGGDQNAFQRNESAWNRGNVDSPGGWSRSWGANWGTGAPGSGFEGSDYQRENLERRNYPYSDYNRRDDRMPYNRQGRDFMERAGDTIRQGWNRAGEAIREGWDRVTDRDDSDRYSDRDRIRNRPFGSDLNEYRGENRGNLEDYGYNDRREREFRRGSEYGSAYGTGQGDYGRDGYNRDLDYENRNIRNRSRDEQDDYARRDRGLYNDFNRSWDR